MDNEQAGAAGFVAIVVSVIVIVCFAAVGMWAVVGWIVKG